MFSRFKKWVNNLCCNLHGHEFQLIKYDEGGKDWMPSVDVAFQCKLCGIKHFEHRWAFVLGSGSLHYFYVDNLKNKTYWSKEDVVNFNSTNK